MRTDAARRDGGAVDVFSPDLFAPDAIGPDRALVDVEATNADAALAEDAGREDATPTCSTPALEQALLGALVGVPNDQDFSLQLERGDGRRLTYNRGTSTPLTEYESASTSKLVTAVIILRQVDKGYLTLADHPQDHILLWPIAATDTLYHVTLEQLLAFTSGLHDEPTCITPGLPNVDFATCARRVGELNAGTGRVPGASFNYSGAHMHVAGLMAVRAAGVGSWQDLFATFQQETGQFATGRYDLPSTTNPRLAGGMHWTGEEYLDFLRALRAGQLLSPAQMANLLADHTASAVIAESPAYRALGEVWHYGQGLWHECENTTSFDCVAGARVSCAGAYGAYPLWDRDLDYLGMLAQQGALGSGFKGVLLVRSLQPQLDAWARCRP